MLPPTDQGHLRKYLATLGVAIVVAAIAVGGFLLQAQNDLLIEQSKLNQASATGRAAIEQKQRIILFVLQWSPLALGILAAGGIGLAVFGLCGWAKRQKVLDQKDALEVEKGTAELEGLRATNRMREQERERAVDEVIADSTEGEAVGLASSGGDSESSTAPGKSGARGDGAAISIESVDGEDAAPRSSVRDEIIAVERELMRKLSQVFGEAYVVNGAQIGGETPGEAGPERLVYLDAVAVDPATKQGFAIDVRLMRSTSSWRYYSGLVNCVKGAIELERLRLHDASSFTPVMIAVIEDHEIGMSRIARFRILLEEAATLFINRPKVLIYSREQFFAMADNRFLFDLN
ncbi:hypothetical protein M8542_04430 [Amycolatopsis sp. OK19-0408]|uniref:Uncharacterized protein n=1 Tax=Amycolatopsis iheyensis TaxID=2945988 RepID=A0A9X2SJA1_9PSEU|nr:hypothetical protein [Amycolatopsis iheyensis]MCR6482050.1 hypothetical protein [Amycolatopsis iheyensis]